jgi:dihydrofolate reductase
MSASASRPKRKIINSSYISLDGVIDNPDRWPAIGSDPDSYGIQTDLLMACDAVVMGRRTYDAFVPVWMNSSGDPFSDRINRMSKYVVSNSLGDPEWANTTVLNGDVVGQIRHLKDEPGQDIVQYGFGPLAHLLLEHGLLDELRLWVHPVFAGTAGADDLLFRAGKPVVWELADTRILSNGIVILSYRLAE